MPSIKSFFIRIKNHLSGRIKDNIIFIHIPKCGGSSISTAIREKYLTLNIKNESPLFLIEPAASSKVVNIMDGNNYPYDETDDFNIMKFRESILLYNLYRKNNKFRFFSGHIPFSDVAYNNFNKNYSFITLLRNPFDRFISTYFYNRYKSSSHYKINMDIEDYLKTNFSKSQGSTYVKFLGGINSSGDYISESSINRAKKNLEKFRIVGFLENINSFSNNFKTEFNVSLNIKKYNQNPAPMDITKREINTEIKEEIVRICHPDFEIYNYARSKFLKED